MIIQLCRGWIGTKNFFKIIVNRRVVVHDENAITLFHIHNGREEGIGYHKMTNSLCDSVANSNSIIRYLLSLWIQPVQRARIEQWGIHPIRLHLNLVGRYSFTVYRTKMQMVRGGYSGSKLVHPHQE